VTDRPRRRRLWPIAARGRRARHELGRDEEGARLADRRLALGGRLAHGLDDRLRGQLVGQQVAAGVSGVHVASPRWIMARATSGWSAIEKK
jgi:hypothetical protein